MISTHIGRFLFWREGGGGGGGGKVPIGTNNLKKFTNLGTFWSHTPIDKKNESVVL